MSIHKKKADNLDNKYFELRNIHSEYYPNPHLPLWIKNELKNQDASILDYGCGLGQNLIALKENHYKNIYGVDIEENALKHCLDNKLVVKKLNIERLNNPFEFKFDFIILSHVIEHIPKNEIIKTLKIIKDRFLMENGILLIAVPNAQSNTNCYWAYEDWTHTTLFTSGSLYYVLKAAGYNNIEFLDIDCSLGLSFFKKAILRIFLAIYKIRITFWNRVTGSAFHQPSPQIYSYEIKAKAS